MREGQRPGGKLVGSAGDGYTRRRGWVEPAIWTERMIAALETGVKGGRWFSLMDKMCAERTLVAAWSRVQCNRGAAGVDRQSIEAFAAHAERYLAELRDDLRTGHYRPQLVKRVWIDKPGSRVQRPLGILELPRFGGELITWST
jgi:RNA-directed DNA polymerase